MQWQSRRTIWHLSELQICRSLAIGKSRRPDGTFGRGRARKHSLGRKSDSAPRTRRLGGRHARLATFAAHLGDPMIARVFSTTSRILSSPDMVSRFYLGTEPGTASSTSPSHKCRGIQYCFQA